MKPIEIRKKARNGDNFTTSGLAKGHVQTNVVIIPKSYAFDFTLFCLIPVTGPDLPPLD